MLESEQNFYQGREQLMVKIKERRGLGILETIEQQSMKIKIRHVPNNLMLLEIPLWRS